MRVSSYLVIAVLVAALGGLALGALLIERQRLSDEDNQALGLRMQQQHALERFSDHTRQLLISIDLLFGSEETYMLEPSSSQLAAALKLSAMVQESLTENDRVEKEQLGAIRKNLTELAGEVADIRHQTQRSILRVSPEQLTRVDDIAQMLVESLTLLRMQFSENLEEQRALGTGSRLRSDVLVPLAVIFYLLSAVAVLWWGSRSVNRPVSQFVASLQEKVAHNRALIESIPDTILVFDRNAGITSLKFGAGFPGTVLREGFSWEDLERTLGDTQAEEAVGKMLTCLDQGTAQQFDITFGEEGDELFYEARTTAINSNELVMIVRDLTAKRQAESRIRHLAYHDGLTGLLNRRAFTENLTQHMEAASVPPSALFFIDVDRFKTINDTHGHDAGDAVLQHVSRCLAEFLRPGDTRGSWGRGETEWSARLGGDEFVVLLPNVADPETAGSIARRLLAAISKPIEHGAVQLGITVSIGVAVCPSHGDTGETLLSHADLAMYKAKGAGGNSVCLYEHKMGESNQRKLSMEAKLRAALANDDLFLMYQPKISLESGRIVGAEALVRWRDGDLVIPPDEFIPLAEKTGLIVSLGDFVTRSAIDQAAEWRRDGLQLDHVAINVSAAQLKQDDFVSSIQSIAADALLEPSCVNIEITESMLMGQYSSAIMILEELSVLGFTIAMDDFGTGYSSLSYLKDLPLDVLKIDRTFIGGINDSTVEKSIITAIVQLGQTLGLRVVAEGVETADQADYLAQIGCDEFQGYLFSPPLPAQEFRELLVRQATKLQLAVQ